jgi:hypothetical protein
MLLKTVNIHHSLVINLNLNKIFFVGKMCVLDCSPSALKLLHSSPEFMPFVIFIAAPGMEQLKTLYAERRAAGGSQRNLTVCYHAQDFVKCYVVPHN